MGIIKKILLSLQESQQRRADYWILQNLSDKELRDIGITRSEIAHTVYCSQGTTYTCTACSELVNYNNI